MGIHRLACEVVSDRERALVTSGAETTFTTVSDHVDGISLVSDWPKWCAPRT